MGYNTDLDGELTITPEATEEQAKEIMAAIEAIESENRNGDLGYDCPWEVSDGSDGFTKGTLIPCGFERPYGYVAWLECIAREILAPRGFTLNGDCWWVGEECDDRGTIYVKDNVVEEIDDVIYNPGPSWDRKPAPDQHDAIKKAIEALTNVPCVGEVYDQQHSDTHMKAVLMLKAAIS